MQWLKRHLTEIFCALFLTVIVGVVAVRNYTPGTFLTGIDNFHIEFDLGLALRRAWNGVWQENQGVGIVSGLAQMTELPRVAVFQAFSWVMPMNLIRYAYVFGNLYLGVIGAFFLIWYLSKSRLVGLAGALFYLFNLGTLQVFFMPTDMFVVNYSALPWLFLLVFKYLSEGKKVSLSRYAGLLLLFAPMAMTPTIFVVYLLFLGIICVGYLMSREKLGVKWKRVAGIIGVTLGMGMYFLLPFVNFALNNARVLTESKINSVFSQENYLMNASRTSWGDLATLKGMWFDYPDNIDGKLVPLLGVWDSYLARLGMWIYLPMIVIGMGIAVILWKKKWQGIAVGVMGVVSLVLLRGENPPVGEFVVWMRGLPLVTEAFRTPYTKIAPILSLIYAICFGYGIYAFGQIWRFKIGRYVWKVFVLSGVMTGLIWLNFPFFKGKLISEGVRVKMPEEYFEMFKFFKNQGRYERVVRLPAHSSQAWDYTNWGYRGSGFLWYVIEQPILDRAFDVWSPYNEGFYNEFSNAIYSCNPVRSDLVGSDNDLQPTRSDLGCKEQVARVIQKYDVKYVLLDESVIAPGQDKEILRIEETKKLAEELGWERVFNEGFLSVYKIPIGSDLPAVESAGWALPLRSDPGLQGISAPGSYTWISGDTGKVRSDVIYEEVGTYVSANQQVSESVITYPFTEMMREEIGGKQNREQANIEYRGDGMVISSEHSLSQESELRIPGWKVGDIVRIDYRDGAPLPAYVINGQNGPVFLGKEKPEDGKSYIVARVSEGEEWGEYLKDSRFKIQDSRIEVEVPGEPQIYDFSRMGQGTIGNCDVLKRGMAEKQDSKYSADERGAVCDYIVMSELDTRLSYLMRMQGENREGRSLKFFLYNTGSKRNDIEYLLEKHAYDQTFSLLPWSFDGTYTLNIETRSFGQYAENRVKPVEVRWIPLEQIARTRILPIRSNLPAVDSAGWDQPLRSNLVITKVQKYGTWLYRISVQHTANSIQQAQGLIRLSQGFDNGWVGFTVSSRLYAVSILKHLKVDGWANGWLVPAGEHQIIIFYWPQLLQYAGFVLLGVTIIVLVRHKD